MEFESLRSIGYLGVLSLLSGAVIAVYGQAEGLPPVAQAAFVILPIPIYAFCRLSEGRDGEIVIRGETLHRELIITSSLLPAGVAVLTAPASVIGIQDLGGVVKQVVGFAAGLGMFAVALLLARPYGVKAEEVVRDIFSSLKELTDG